MRKVAFICWVLVILVALVLLGNTIYHGDSEDSSIAISSSLLLLGIGGLYFHFRKKKEDK